MFGGSYSVAAHDWTSDAHSWLPHCLELAKSEGFKQGLLLSSTVLLFIWSVCMLRTRAAKKTLMLDQQCFTIPESWKYTKESLVVAMRKGAFFDNDAIDFQQKILERSGLGDATGLSEGIIKLKDGCVPKTSMQDALDETETIMYSVVGDLLERTGIHPHEIGVVMASCSCFAPTPSMAAMLVNKFGMRSDVLTYNLSGMGCSSSLVCVDMAAHLLKALPNRLVLVVNHENITQNWYKGLDKSMLVVNCLFRAGGAAALLTNRPKDRSRAKYELLTSVRTHLGAQDDAFGCMGVAEDDKGFQGVFLKKNVIEVAGRALTQNITCLAPKVLPLMQLAKAACNRKYVPDFSRAFDHFLLHTGGRGVLDTLEESLKLTPKQAQPSKDTLFRFGNTSAASTWYILSRIESSTGVKKGDRIWQLGFGGGFKACSAVWRARKNIKQRHTCWE